MPVGRKDLKYLYVIVGLATQPRATAGMLERGHQWVVPFVLASAVTLLTGWFSLSAIKPLLEAEIVASGVAKNAPGAFRAWERFAIVGVYLSPVLLLTKWLFSSVVIYATCIVCGMRLMFISALNIVGYCALFLLAQDLVVFGAGFWGVKTGAITSLSGLVTPVGLDIFFQPSSIFLKALVSYFTPLQVWSLAACGLAISGAARVTPAIGLAVLAPLILIQIMVSVGSQLLASPR